MTATNRSLAFGWRVYGLGVAGLGVLALACGTFDPGQTVPKDFPGRKALAYAAAAALTVYYALIVVVPMNGSVLIAHYAVFGTYEALAIQLAMPAARKWRRC